MVIGKGFGLLKINYYFVNKALEAIGANSMMPEYMKK